MRLHVMDDDNIEHETNSNEDSVSKSGLKEDEAKFSFTPQQAHIFGGQSIFISFVTTGTPLDETFFYYVMFEGSKLRHITSAKVLNPYTLQAVIPDHNEAELVILSACYHASQNGESMTNILATDTFVFTSDSSQFLAQQLAQNALESSALLHLEGVYASLLDISNKEKRKLDAKLTASFRNIVVPTSWSLVADTEEESDNKWTLLHFCAKYAFPRFAEYLLGKHGAVKALSVADEHGHTPLDISIQKDDKNLIEIFSRRKNVARVHNVMLKDVRHEKEKYYRYFYAVVDGLPTLQECLELGIPCEEGEAPESTESEAVKPSVKRHNLGTTTITNKVSEEKDDIFKDLMLLKELDKLAASSKEDSFLENGDLSSPEEPSPLAESLKKLHEINEEIRRLRSMSLKEDTEHERIDLADGSTDPNANFIPQQKDKRSSDSFVELSIDDSLNESTDSVIDQDIDTSVEESQVTEKTDQEEAIEAEITDEKECETPSSVPAYVKPELERRLSNVSVSKVDDVEIAEVVEILPTAFEEFEPISEIVPEEIQITNIDDECDGDTDGPELNLVLNKLESVTEETEEELQEDVSKPKYDGLVSISQTRSLTELPPHPPKRVGILKKSALKKDRPLSDSFENLKMVENQGIIDLYQGSNPNASVDKKEIILARGHSLDALMNDRDGDECAHSEPSTTSQISLTDRNDSEDSLTSDYDSPKSRSRAGSDKYRASSLLSLNEHRLSSASSQDDIRHSKKVSIFSRIAFKKAKSLSSLEIVERRSEEDRRKTIACDIDINQVSSKSTKTAREESLSLEDFVDGNPNRENNLNNSSRMSSHDYPSRMSSLDYPSRMSSLDYSSRMSSLDYPSRMSSLDYPSRLISLDNVFTGDEDEDMVTHEDMCGEILVRLSAYESEAKKSQSSCSIDQIGKDEAKEKEKGRSRRMSTSALPKSYGRKPSDYHSGGDTDEETSVGIAEQHAASHERKPSVDDKHKKKYSLFRSGKPKEKKLNKEKDKKDNRERKDSDSKAKKKLQSSKPDFPLPGKSDSISSFLTKRGTSFRQNFKSSNDSKANDKQMFMRSSAANSNSKHDAVNKLLRSSDRRSPVSGRKISSAIHEEPNDVDWQSNIAASRNLAGSRTSLDSLNLVNDDDIDAPYIPDDEVQYDSDLDAKEEPETWSELVDKKVQRKMHAKDIKRQDVIYELIQTEAVYVRVLQVMRKIYTKGMKKSLGMETEVIDKIFPMLSELIELNESFLKAMKTRQEESPNYCIESIGDILLEFFGGENGEMLKQAYGYFCSRHLEALSVYKELLKSEKKFANFMKQCLLNDRARRLGIPGCITYVTLRMTKYPLLIEAIIKATKESKPDYEHLKKSLTLVKEVLVAVDESVNFYEQRKELALLKKNLDRKNVVEIKIGASKTVYKTTKLFHKRSRLLFDKKTILRGKNKSYDARMIVLAEKIIFFQDNGGGKLQLLSADNKAPVLSLKNLMVREVATDNKALFLVSTSKDAAQIYEIVCDSYKDKKDFMPKLQGFIKDCPEEEEENLTDLEEEARKEEEERMMKLKEITEQLQLADEKVSNIMSDKNRLVHEMRELIDCMDELGPVKGSACNELKPPDITSARVTLESCLEEVNQLATTVCQQPDQPLASPTTPSLVNNNSNPNLTTKRSDTYPNFEQRAIKPSTSYGSVNRAVSMKPSQGKLPGVLETDSGKPRRQSQLLSVLGRNKTMGSSEDLTSLSSSTSMGSLSTTLSQINLFQSLKDNLGAMVDVTNKQDLEVGRMRYDLQESRNEVMKLNQEKKELEDRLQTQQKDSDRQVRQEKDQYAKLAREFKRTTERLYRQMDEKKVQYQQLLDTYNDLKMGVHNGGKSNSRSNQEDGLFV